MMCALATVCVAGLAAVASADMVDNGSFEDNAAGGLTFFNLSNADFTAAVDDATAFGSSEELDLVIGNDLGLHPIDGKYKVGMHQRTDDPSHIDAFSLTLSSQVVAGGSYTLSFWTCGLGGAPTGNVEIGLSSSATDFGNQIFSGAADSITGWTHYTHVFNAPADAGYLTVRVQPGFGMYAFVDDISLVPSPAAAAVMVGGLLAGARRRR